MFPKRIDNTIRSAFVVCGMQAKYAYVDDLSPIGESVHLLFGGAFAAGLEAARRAFYEQGKPPGEAVVIGIDVAQQFYGDFSPPVNSPKTRANLDPALRYYFTSWPMQNDTYRPHRMEWRFEVPIPGMIHPDDGGDIMYCGRPDTYGDVGDVFTVEDDKTASSLGESWAKQWALDSQFTGYWWAGQELGVLPKGGSNPVLIRGQSILKPKYEPVAMLPGDPQWDTPAEVKMTGRANAKVETRYKMEYRMAESFGHSQAMVYRPQWMLDRWLKQLKKDVGRMIYAYENGEWDFALHKNACAAYGGCSYLDLCLSQNPEQWIPVNFTKRKWDPMEVV